MTNLPLLPPQPRSGVTPGMNLRMAGAADFSTDIALRTEGPVPKRYPPRRLHLPLPSSSPSSSSPALRSLGATPPVPPSILVLSSVRRS
mmetsp:Transcript_8086/g.19345  ORF Transcript_8086/g.19345 Transcript_8086/m.19345 type:complete len:89 (+) Transcript_8086:1827-2093(+)